MYNYNQDWCMDYCVGFDVRNLFSVFEGEDNLDKIMQVVKDWLIGKDIEMVIVEEELKVKSGKQRVCR